MSCLVKGCTNIKRFKPEGITFHRLPKGEMLKNWLQVLGIEENWQWSANKFICSKHFKKSDLIKLGHKVFLKTDAVPNLIVAEGTHMVASTSSQQENEQESTATDEFSLTMQSTSFSSTINVSSTQTLTQTSSSDDTIHSGLRTKLKRKSSGDETSRSTDSSTKRKRVKFIQSIHNYSVSPGKMKKKITELRKVQRNSRRKLYSVTKAIRNLKRKITTLKTVIQDLKQK